MPYIYALCDPDTQEVRYVGKTKSIQERYKAHLTSQSSANTHRKYWIRSLRKQGKKPLIKVLEEVDASIWKERERWWIAEMRQQGARLTNLTDGGEGTNGYKHTPETKAKISASNTGKKKTLNPDVMGPEHFNKGRVPHNKGVSMSKEQVLSLVSIHQKLTLEQIEEVRRLLREGNLYQWEIAQMFNVAQPTIHRIKKGYVYFAEKECNGC